MMQGSTAWAVLFAVLSVLVGWVYLIRKKKAAEEERKWEGRAPLPPGTFGLPVLGETLDYLKNVEVSSLSFFTQRIAKYGEVFKTHLFLSPVVYLGLPLGNKFLFANENTLVQTQWPGSVAELLGPHSLATKVGEEHKRARRLFATFFSPEGLQSFVPRMDATARAHLAKYWDGKDRILGMPTMKKFTFLLAAELFVSISEGPEFDVLDEAVEDYMRGVLMLPINLPGFPFYKAKLARKVLLRTLGPIITRRRQDLKHGKVLPRQDLLSVLISNPDENGQPLSDEAIKDNIILLLFAGHETSSTTMTLVLKYLSLNSECLKVVIEEQQEVAKEKAGGTLSWEDTRRMKYTWRCVQETLRIQPVINGTFRVGMKDFEYGGYTIPKGWLVAWSALRSHKSPEFFPNPDKFDPSRFEGSGPAPYTYIPFGGGPHICLGQEFAKVEMLVLLHYLVLNYEWSMVDPKEQIHVKPVPMFEKELQLNIQKREIPLV